MAFYYHQDIPPVHFSTFKPIPPKPEEPKDPIICHARLIPPGEPEIMSKQKDTPPFHSNTAHEEPARKPGAMLKEKTYRWFERTQRSKLMKKGHFPDWFHGFLTRTRAEEMLQEKPLGCFLIRFCESRVGFVLSYRGAERCRHFILNQKDDEQYVIEGEESTHPRLEDLIHHYSICPVQPYYEILTVPCGKNPRTHDPSPGPQVNSADTATGGQMYGRIGMHSKVLPGTVPVSATSPKEKGKAPFEENIPVEYASSSFIEKETPPSGGVHEGPSGDYTAVVKPSRDPMGSKNKKPSPGPTYTSPELHTYTEPDLWTTQGDSFDNTHDPIAFYAVGRGSSSESMENVYSEVDINSMALNDSRANQYHQVGFATVARPMRKAFQHKPTSYHSSLRLHKQPDVTQEDRGKGMCSKHSPKSKTKPQVPVQFDDPMYGKSAICHTNPLLCLSLDDQENVYEKIPENFPVNPEEKPFSKERKLM